MKKIALISVLLLTCNLFAYDNYQGIMGEDHHDRKHDQRFQDAKERILEKENQHLKVIQANMDCVRHADSMKDLQFCREKAKERNDAFKAQFPPENMPH